MSSQQKVDTWHHPCFFDKFSSPFFSLFPGYCSTDYSLPQSTCSLQGKYFHYDCANIIYFMQLSHRFPAVSRYTTWSWSHVSEICLSYRVIKFCFMTWHILVQSEKYSWFGIKNKNYCKRHNLLSLLFLLH